MDTHNKHKPQALSETHTTCPMDRSSSTRKSQKQAAKLLARSTKTLQRYVQTPEYCLVCMCVGGCVGATVCISVPSTKTLQRFLRMDVCTYSYLYFTYIRRRCTYAYLYACMCACACVHTYMHTCVRAPYIHIYMLTYTHTCIHTCTHTHIHAGRRRGGQQLGGRGSENSRWCCRCGQARFGNGG